MKTTTSEVKCDACKNVIPVMHPTAIFATLKGPKIGHKKGDVCDGECLVVWTYLLASPDEADTLRAEWIKEKERKKKENKQWSLKHSDENCPLVNLRIACDPCGYGINESRYLSVEDFLKQ